MVIRLVGVIVLALLVAAPGIVAASGDSARPVTSMPGPGSSALYQFYNLEEDGAVALDHHIAVAFGKGAKGITAGGDDVLLGRVAFEGSLPEGTADLGQADGNLAWFAGAVNFGDRGEYWSLDPSRATITYNRDDDPGRSALYWKNEQSYASPACFLANAQPIALPTPFPACHGHPMATESEYHEAGQGRWDGVTLDIWEARRGSTVLQAWMKPGEAWPHLLVRIAAGQTLALARIEAHLQAPLSGPHFDHLDVMVPALQQADAAGLPAGASHLRGNPASVLAAARESAACGDLNDFLAAHPGARPVQTDGSPSWRLDGTQESGRWRFLYQHGDQRTSFPVDWWTAGDASDVTLATCTSDPHTEDYVDHDHDSGLRNSLDFAAAIARANQFADILGEPHPTDLSRITWRCHDDCSTAAGAFHFGPPGSTLLNQDRTDGRIVIDQYGRLDRYTPTHLASNSIAATLLAPFEKPQPQPAPGNDLVPLTARGPATIDYVAFAGAASLAALLVAARHWIAGGVIAILQVRRPEEKRERIITTVTATPGIHRRELMRVTGLGKGVLEHHVRHLERRGHLTVIHANGYACHFIPGAQDHAVLAAAGQVRSRTAQAILRFVVQTPGTPGAAIARALGHRRTLTHYHLGRLQEHGLVARDAAGFVPTDDGQAAWALMSGQTKAMAITA